MADIDLTSDIEDGSLDRGSPPVDTGTVQAPAGTVKAGSDAAAPAVDTKRTNSLRDELTAAFRSNDGEPTGQEAAASADGRARDENGRFIPKEAAAPTGAEVPTGQQQTLQPPRGLDAAGQQVFAQLPAEMQQFVARTMESVEQAAAQYQTYAQLEQSVLGPRREAWAMNGMTETQAINQLLALSDFAGRAPEDFVLWFAQQHGIDLDMVAQGGEEVDPVIAELRGQVQNLSGQLNQFTQGQQQQAHTNVVNEVVAFSEQKDEKGNPLRPYFTELGSTILPFIQTVQAENPNMARADILAQAYDRACWGTPSIRAKLIAAQDAQRLASQRETAGRARQAGSSVTGAPGDGVAAPTSENRSLRDEIKAQFSAARATV